MQFILKKSNDHNSSINSLNNFDYINNAINYLKKSKMIFPILKMIKLSFMGKV
ncbi:hypothetical protein MASR2M54_12540 [Aliarcobacter cryaerophilus]